MRRAQSVQRTKRRKTISLSMCKFTQRYMRRERALIVDGEPESDCESDCESGWEPEWGSGISGDWKTKALGQSVGQEEVKRALDLNCLYLVCTRFGCLIVVKQTAPKGSTVVFLAKFLTRISIGALHQQRRNIRWIHCIRCLWMLFFDFLFIIVDLLVVNIAHVTERSAYQAL